MMKTNIIRAQPRERQRQGVREKEKQGVKEIQGDRKTKETCLMDEKMVTRMQNQKFQAL